MNECLRSKKSEDHKQNFVGQHNIKSKLVELVHSRELQNFVQTESWKTYQGDFIYAESNL